jgi:electron transport complex protein RnfG
MNRGFAYHGAVLGVFCLGFGALLAITNRLTAADIAARMAEDREASLGQVIPAALHDNDLLADVVKVPNDQGQPVTVYRARKRGAVSGVAYEILGNGYGGPIRLMLGVGSDGRILGVRVLAHKETPGLGDKIEVKKSDWIERFTGLSLGVPPADKWKVKKDGGQFDQFTGATITPRGVVKAIRDGLAFFDRHRVQLTEAR